MNSPDKLLARAGFNLVPPSGSHAAQD
jgi:hypothetical protein